MKVKSISTQPIWSLAYHASISFAGYNYFFKDQIIVSHTEDWYSPKEERKKKMSGDLTLNNARGAGVIHQGCSAWQGEARDRVQRVTGCSVCIFQQASMPPSGCGATVHFMKAATWKYNLKEKTSSGRGRRRRRRRRRRTTHEKALDSQLWGNKIICCLESFHRMAAIKRYTALYCF